jgi:hypothetical protein
VGRLLPSSWSIVREAIEPRQDVARCARRDPTARTGAPRNRARLSPARHPTEFGPTSATAPSEQRGTTTGSATAAAARMGLPNDRLKLRLANAGPGNPPSCGARGAMLCLGEWCWPSDQQSSGLRQRERSTPSTCRLGCALPTAAAGQPALLGRRDAMASTRSGCGVRVSCRMRNKGRPNRAA